MAKKSLSVFSKIPKKIKHSPLQEVGNNRIETKRRGRPQKEGMADLHVSIEFHSKMEMERLRKKLGMTKGKFVNKAILFFVKTCKDVNHPALDL